MARIAWIEDADATGPLAEMFAEARAARAAAGMEPAVPDILRAMSVRPDFLQAIREAAKVHFTDGALSRAQHEMIASYVSALNKCRY
jgi:hypothetical protein